MKRLAGALVAMALVFSAQAVELFSSGTYITGTNTNGDTISQALAYGTGPTGEANSTAGFNCDRDESMAIADDFVSSQTWDVQSLKVYAYQTLATAGSTTPTLTAIYVRIYSGDPAAGGVLVAGDTTTNRLVGSSFTGAFRVFNGTSTPSFLLNKQRPVMEYVADLSWVPDLAPGNYWVAVTAQGSLTSGPWWVPTTELSSNDSSMESEAVWSSLQEEQLVLGAPQNPAVQRPRDLMFKIDGNVVSSTTVVQPNFVSIGPGGLLSGGLASLFSSDEDKYIARPGAVLVASARPLVVVIEGTAPASTASVLQFVLESSASASNANEQVEIYNFSTSSYDSPVSDTLASTTDVVKTLNIANPADHIGPSNLMRVRVSYKTTGPVLVYPWQARLDEATWRFTP